MFYFTNECVSVFGIGASPTISKNKWLPLSHLYVWEVFCFMSRRLITFLYLQKHKAKSFRHFMVPWISVKHENITGVDVER